MSVAQQLSKAPQVGSFSSFAGTRPAPPHLFTVVIKRRDNAGQHGARERLTAKYLAKLWGRRRL